MSTVTVATSEIRGLVRVHLRPCVTCSLWRHQLDAAHDENDRLRKQMASHGFRVLPLVDGNEANTGTMSMGIR